MIEFHKKPPNKGANIGINRKFDSPSLIYYRCRRQGLIEVFLAGPVCKFSLVLTFPCLNGCFIWWYWSTRQTLILNQSHRFRMLKEVQVLGMGLSFWSKRASAFWRLYTSIMLFLVLFSQNFASWSMYVYNLWYTRLAFTVGVQ